MNVILTIVGDDFKALVAEKIRERNEKVAVKNDLMVEMDPEIAEAFNRSTMIST